MRTDATRARALKLIAELQLLMAEWQPESEPPPRTVRPRPLPDIPHTPSADVLTVAEACQRLGISRTTLYYLIREGQIPSVKMGKRRGIPSDALSQWIEAQRTDIA